MGRPFPTNKIPLPDLYNCLMMATSIGRKMHEYSEYMTLY